METLKFKTNIKCSGCVAKVTPELNRVAGEHNWEVDTQDPGKILTVKTAEADSNDIIMAVKMAGFTAEAGVK